MLRDLVCHFPPAFDAFAGVASAGRLVDARLPACPRSRRRRRRRRSPPCGRPRSPSPPSARSASGRGACSRVVRRPRRRLRRAQLRRTRRPVRRRPALRIGRSSSLSALRGRLMAEAGRAAASRGRCSRSRRARPTSSRVLAEQSITLTLANKNTPTQTVLSGPAAEIDRAAKAFAAAKIGNVRLEVAAAFHTPPMAAACAPLRAALDAEPMPAGPPVYANTTGGLYPDDAAPARDLLADQLARPVEWVRQIEAMLAAGVRTFLEVGPGARLTGLVEAIANGRGRPRWHSTPRRARRPASPTWRGASPRWPRGATRSASTCGIRSAETKAAQAGDDGPTDRGELHPPQGAATRPRRGAPPRSDSRTDPSPPESRRPTPMNQPTPTPAPAVDASALTRALDLTRESLRPCSGCRSKRRRCTASSSKGRTTPIRRSTCSSSSSTGCCRRRSACR